MKSKKIWVNLSVEDLDRTTKFYTELGFKPNDKRNSKELTSFFVGDDDFIIHFFIKEKFKTAIKSQAADLEQGN